MAADDSDAQGGEPEANERVVWAIDVDQRVLAGAAARLYRPLLQLPSTPDHLGTWLSIDDGRISLAATSPVVSAEVRFDPISVVRDSDESPSSWVIAPMHLFTQLARRLPAGQVSLRAEGGQLHIGAGRFRMTTKLIDPTTQAAPRSSADAHTALDVSGADFADAVTHVAFLGEAGKGWMDRAVPFSVHGNRQLELMVTDRNHLALALIDDVEVTGAGLGDGRVLVPVPAVLGLDRVMSSVDRAQIRISSDQVEFELGDLTLRSTVGGASEPFSTPMTSIPRSHRIVVTRRSLATVMRRVSHAARSWRSVLWLEWNGETPIARTADVELVQAEVSFPAEVSGDPFEIGIGMRLFGEMVARLPEGRVVIEFDRQDKIAAISSEAHPGVLYFTGLVAVPHLPWR